jgi:hypothetical protein
MADDLVGHKKVRLQREHHGGDAPLLLLGEEGHLPN